MEAGALGGTINKPIQTEREDGKTLEELQTAHIIHTHRTQVSLSISSRDHTLLPLEAKRCFTISGVIMQQH